MSEHFNIPEDISILIIEFLEGNIADENLSRLNSWLKEDEAHLNQFNALKSVWLMNSKASPYEAQKIDNDLDKVKDKIVSRIEPQIRHLWTFKKVAASWIVFLVTGGLLGMLVSREKAEPSSALAITTITAPVGAKSIVDLPDGSKVWINAGSTITYNNSFGKLNRDLKLVGEAYFSVKTNPSLPFIVKTSDIMVKALGTKFNVKAYPEEKTITTTLEEGKIIVTSLKEKSPDKVVELKPREMITYVKSQIQPENTENQESVKENGLAGTLTEIVPEIKTELQTSWKDATWIIEGKTLGELAPLLERRYNVVISFGKKDIEQFKFTGKIQNETIEQILMAIELSSPVKFSISNNNISLFLNKALLDEYSQNTN